MHHPSTVGASLASPRRRATMRHQSALLKRILRSERATGALAIVNHHSNRLRSLLAAPGDDRVGRIMVEYLLPRMIPERSYFIQLCRRAHVVQRPNSNERVPETSGECR